MRYSPFLWRPFEMKIIKSMKGSSMVISLPFAWPHFALQDYLTCLTNAAYSHMKRGTRRRLAWVARKRSLKP